MVSLMVAEIKEGIRGLQGVHSDGNYSKQIGSGPPGTQGGISMGGSSTSPHLVHTPPKQVKIKPHTLSPPLAEALPPDHQHSVYQNKCQNIKTRLKINFLCAAEFEMDSYITISSCFRYVAEGFAKPISDNPGSCFAACRSLKTVNYFCLACFRPLILKRFSLPLQVRICN